MPLESEREGVPPPNEQHHMFLSGMLARGPKRVKASSSLGLSHAVRWLLVVVWIGGIFYLSHQSSPAGMAAGNAGAIPAHLGLYTGLALLLYWSLAGGLPSKAGTPVWALATVAFALTVLYGVADETHQAFVSGRVASEADLAVDGAGALIGVTLAILMPRLRKSYGARH
jgi:VanZ family protein